MKNFEQIILEIKSRDIVEVISDYLELKNNKGRCPFHNDHNPSFSVSQAKQYFHCFGCGKAGDVITFIMEIENLSFIDAVTFLAKRLGIDIPNISDDEKSRAAEKRLHNEILTETANYYHSCLTEDVRKYINEEWKFSDETINAYKIGFAKGGLYQYLAQKNFKLGNCLTAGVLNIIRENEIIDFFSDRIIIPNIFRGYVVHLVGRSLTDTDPKYLNIRGQIEYFFNEGCLPQENLIIVEGPKDCITLLQNNFNAIGIYGTNQLHSSKVERIFSGCKTLYLCLDADEAGRKATAEFTERFSDKIKIVSLPEGQDVNDFFQQHTKENFDKLLEEAKDPITYHLNNIPSNAPKSELVQLLDPIVKTCARLSEPMVEAMLNEIKEKFDLSSFERMAYRNQIKKYKKDNTLKRNSREEKKSEVILTINYPGVVDVAEYNGKLYFLKKENEELKVLSGIKEDGKVYLPPKIKDIPWKCPGAEKVVKYYNLFKQGNQEEVNKSVFTDLVEKLKSTSSLPDEAHYLLTATWVLHTYFQEQIQFTPIICLFAAPATGKSRTGRGMINLAFHGITRETVRQANIIRDATDLRASLFFDISNFWKSVERNQSEDIILGRFEKGTIVSRVMFPDLGSFQDTVHYEIFGPTIIATNYPLDDKLDSRSIPICMKDSKQDFKNNVKPEDYLELKEKLTALRAIYFNQQLPDTEKPAGGRLGNIMKPLRQMVLLIQPDLDDRIMSLIKIIEEDRMNIICDTLDAQILKILYEMNGFVINGKLSVEEITNYYNEDLPEREKKSNYSVGWRLRSLGLPRARTSQGNAAIEYNTDLIVRLIRKYGLHHLLKNPPYEVRPNCDDEKVKRYVESSEPLDFPRENTEDNTITEVIFPPSANDNDGNSENVALASFPNADDDDNSQPDRPSDKNENKDAGSDTNFKTN